MRVSYAIHTGTPGEIAGAACIGSVTMAEAIEAFRKFRDDSERIGNCWRNAELEIDADYVARPTRCYRFGPRGGIVRVDV